MKKHRLLPFNFFLRSLLIFFGIGGHLIQSTWSQTASSPLFKPVPVFSSLVKLKAENLIVFDNISLDSTILTAEASTYKEAMPITFSLINAEPYFRIDSTTGRISLYSLLDKTNFNYSFTIVAKDSAQYPDQQQSYLDVNVKVIVSESYLPEFDQNYLPYHKVISEFINPGSMIYDSIYVTDKNAGQLGFVNVYCDKTSNDNIDAALSCDYFAVETNLINMTKYQVFIRLIKRLDFQTKKNFIISLKAQLLFQPTFTQIATVLIEINNQMSHAPQFLNSSYLIFINKYLELGSSVLQVAVRNVDLNGVSNKTFTIYDPKGLFGLSQSPPVCKMSICTQTIQLISSLSLFKQLVQYSFEVFFNIISYENRTLTTSTVVNVIIEHSKVALNAPVFKKTNYRFDVSENVKAGSYFRNLTININDPNRLSIYKSGISMALLGVDMRPSREIFELVPTYGQGHILASFRLKSNTNLDYESGKTKYNFVLKAWSRSSPNLFSYANLTINVLDYNEYAPMFPSSIYSVVISNPENYQLNDGITQLTAYDQDTTDGSSLTYSVVGAYQDRFYIDQYGNVRLLQQFNLNRDPDYIYNLTITATDRGGLTNYTNLIIYLNVTTSIFSKQTLFECALIGAKAELSSIDKKSLFPPLFILGNSIYETRYFLAESIPDVPQLRVGVTTGMISLDSPLDPDFLSKYDRILLNVLVYQVQNVTIFGNPLYLSSVTCSASIYLQSPNSSLSYRTRRPYFLRQFTALIDRESVFKNMALIKVDAISMNQNIFLPLSYSLLNDYNQSFVIDSTQGFIYPRYDLGLTPGTYQLQVQATDSIDQSYSITNVIIVILYKSTNKLKCSTNYLLIRLYQNEVNANKSFPMSIGQLSCSSNSYFNDSNMVYEISRPLFTYDCNGNKNDYIPNIGINSKTGNIVSFTSLSRESFCESIFLITIRKDDISIVVPFKLVILKNSNFGQPVFIYNNGSSTIYLKNYANIGTYVTTIIAYDSIQMDLIRNYEIIWQPPIGKNSLGLFRIDKITGIITLNVQLDPTINFSSSKAIATLTIRAVSNNGVNSADMNIYVDYSKLTENSCYFKYSFDLNLPNSINLIEGSVLSDPIYRSVINCNQITSNSYTYVLEQAKQCGPIDYALSYINDPSNKTNFLIDSNTGFIYLSTSNWLSRNLQEKYLIVINATFAYNYFDNFNNYLLRYVNSIQKNFTLNVKSSIENQSPQFEKPIYGVQILDTVPADSLILTLRYQLQKSDMSNQIRFSMEQASNVLIDRYFSLSYSPSLRAIYLTVKSAPLPIDKPDINFVVRIRYADTIYGSSTASSIAQVNIRVIASEQSQGASYPSFLLPPYANLIVNLNATNGYIANNTIVYQLRAVSQSQNSFLIYRLVNQDKMTTNHFYIENNLIRVLNPFTYDTPSKKFTYLLFIQAVDTINPANSFTYTTLEIRLNNLYDIFPYFNRDRTNGRIQLTIDDNLERDCLFYDLNPLIVLPSKMAPSSKFYFYVFEYESETTSRLSELFYVNPLKRALSISRELNANVKNYYKLFVFITITPISDIVFKNPSLNNTSLLFIDIKVTVPYKNRPNFIDYTEYIFVDKLATINQKIGLVLANTNFNDSIFYYFETCEYITTSIVYKDLAFCTLFGINEQSGVITTNSSNYESFQKNSFYLKVIAAYKDDILAKNSVEIRVFIVNPQEKARFVFARAPLQNINDFFRDLRNQLNSVLNDKYNGVYYLSFDNYGIPCYQGESSDLDACFYIINRKQMKVLAYQQTKDLLLNLEGIKRLLAAFSVATIQRCYNREDKILFGYSLYNLETTEWKFTSVSIGLLVLAALCILLIVISIICLIFCWASHMRHAIMAPTIECETIDTDSNNGLLD